MQPFGVSPDLPHVKLARVYLGLVLGQLSHLLLGHFPPGLPMSPQSQHSQYTNQIQEMGINEMSRPCGQGGCGLRRAQLMLGLSL